MMNKPPVEIGQEIDVKIESIGAKGSGVARYKGYVLFIEDVTIGSSYKVAVSKITPKFAFAQVLETLQEN